MSFFSLPLLFADYFNIHELLCQYFLIKILFFLEIHFKVLYNDIVRMWKFLREFEFTADNKYSGHDIKYILKDLWGFSENLITLLKKGDGILLNGKKAFVTKVVSFGDVLKITLPEESSDTIIKSAIPLSVLYEDEDIILVNKPHNMPTHPSVGHYEDTLANAVMHYFCDIPFKFRAITRLDRDTSGVVLIAKNIVAADRLSKELLLGKIKKEYAALLVGVPAPQKGRIDAPIKREKEGIIKRCVSPDGKPSVTDYEVIKTKDNLSLVRLLPKTGRTHQLRLHLAYIGTPIYSDFLYGTEVPNERLRLHCRRLEFIHPFSGKPMKITAPLPDDMNI